MIHEDIQLTGSFQASGSFTLPNHATSASIANPTTGSMYNDTTDNVAKIYTGTEWVTVGEQTGPGAGADIEYLVVAGGGGAGFDLTAGGGAGGLLSSSLSSMESGSSITVTVGAGGAGYTTGGVTSTADGGASSIASSAGTSFTTVSTVGGGGGSRVVSTPGRDGGSGGGCGRGNQGNTTPGSGTTGQGNDGGADSDSPAGTGGGGAGAAGSSSSGTGNPATGGAGGAGKASSITGTSTSYAGGGGGGGYYGSGGAGGTGGGGTGGTGNAQNNATNGTANTGGGAGGGEQNATVARSGGSGVAIFAYPTSSLSAIGGSSKTSRSGGYVVHTFNSSGTLTVGGADDFPVINNEAFSPILYTGNGNNSDGGKVVTGLNFQPDLMFVKNRTSSGENWAATDVVSGFGKILYPNLTNAQVGSDDTYFTENSDGFDVNTNNLNISTHNYVAWCWKAGGTAVSNTDGSITSQVSANTDAGFSIVKYTGTLSSSGNISVGHGLSNPPELIISKRIDSTGNWRIRPFFLNNNPYDYLEFDTGALAQLNSSDGTMSLPTSTTFDNNWNTALGGAGEVIAYCFTSITGYQKVGSYEGNNDSGDQSITGVGFQPRFLLLKNADDTGNWIIIDSVRGQDEELYPNLSNVESNEPNRTSFDSDGFTVRNGRYNNNGDTFIYLAIA